MYPPPQVPLIVNNAYGCQSKMNMKTLTAAGRRGRIDGIVQSTGTKRNKQKIE